MFTAIVIICNTFMAKECMLAYDVHGPYKTKAECMARIEEMTTDIEIEFRSRGLPLAPVGYKCEKKKSI